MSQRSRSRQARRKSSRRNTWIGLAIIALLVISAAGIYTFAATQGGKSSNSSTSNSSTSTGSSVSGSGPYAVLNTSLGTIVIQLFPQAAPKTVANFESLANSGFYTDLVWHRIDPGFVIQTGDPTTKNAGGNRSLWGSGSGPNTVPLETNPAYPNASGTWVWPGREQQQRQLAVLHQPRRQLGVAERRCTVFGKVVSGMSVVDTIAAVPIYTSTNLAVLRPARKSLLGAPHQRYHPVLRRGRDQKQGGFRSFPSPPREEGPITIGVGSYSVPGQRCPLAAATRRARRSRPARQSYLYFKF